MDESPLGGHQVGDGEEASVLETLVSPRLMLRAITGRRPSTRQETRKPGAQTEKEPEVRGGAVTRGLGNQAELTERRAREEAERKERGARRKSVGAPASSSPLWGGLTHVRRDGG